MFRLRVFFRSSSNAIKSAMLEPVGTSSSSGGGSSCITSLRAQSTQVRTQLRPDAVIPPPHTVCSNCSKSTPTLEPKAHLKVQQQQLGEQSPQWKPKCILLQPNPTEDLPWDPSDILSSRLTVTPEGKVQHNKPPLQTSAQSASLPVQSSPNSPSFHYTLDPSSLPKLRPNQRQLTTEQRAFYEENGYIIIPKLISDADLERYARRFKDYATGVLRTPPGMVVQKEVTKKGEPLTEKTLYKLQELYTDDVLFGYCRDPNILDYVSNFVGPDVLAIHSMFINKPPIDSSSSRHPLHQEIHYFPIRPVEKIVCSWMPLEATNRENGCLVVVPGSHKMEHLEHDYPDWEGGVNKFYYGIKDAKLAEKRIHVEMEPGDALFFSPLVIHGSGMNRSSGFRKAFSCHFASAHCDFISVNGTIQEKLANEILGTYVNKLNNETVDEKLKATKIDYPTMWRLRSRLVRGSGPFKRA